MQRVKQVVDWAVEDDLYVVLNLHHDSWQWIAGMPTDHDAVLARFNATWSQIADHIPGRAPPGAVRERQRTPVQQCDRRPEGAAAQRAEHLLPPVVRATGGGNSTRLLVLPPPGSSPSESLMDDLAAMMASLNDDNLVATVHYYGYWPFSANIAGVTTFDTATQQDMDTAFTRCTTSSWPRESPSTSASTACSATPTTPGPQQRRARRGAEVLRAPRLRRPHRRRHHRSVGRGVLHRPQQSPMAVPAPEQHDHVQLDHALGDRLIRPGLRAAPAPSPTSRSP